MEISGRDVALRVLTRVERDRAFAAAVLSSELQNVEDRREVGLAYELVYGVLRTQPWLDHILNSVSERGLKKVAPDVMHAMRLGAYQIIFLERIPSSAAVYHAVETVRRSRARNLAGLVNALLRNISRMPAASRMPGTLNMEMSDSQLALRSGLPPWLLNSLVTHYGRGKACALASTFNRPPRRTLRINLNRIPRDTALQQLGKSATAGTLTPWSVDVDDAEAARRLTADGRATYQDEAAQLSVLALEPKPTDRILDACAGRGGKTGAIAMLAGTGAELLAVDRSESKLQRLSFELQRQKLTADTMTWDLAATNRLPNGPFDKILLDAPCSGTGTLGRRPEIRWRLDESAIENLSANQALLLEKCADLLAPGGRLVYVVCSILPEEGATTASRFLSRNHTFTSTPSPPLQWPKSIPWNDGHVLIDPSQTQTDGYQILSMTRRPQNS